MISTTVGGPLAAEDLGERAEAAMLQTLASFAPPPFVRLLTEMPDPATPVRLPQQAAVLFADITGFTRLTERLCREGEVGVELLASTLNAYFGLVIDRISECGGEVVRFAGDGLIAMWAAPDAAATDAASSDGLTACAEHAARCALLLQTTLRSLRPIHGITMAMRIGIGAGAATLRQLGGQTGRWEFVFSGPALAHASRACPLVEPGEVGLSPEVASRLAPQLRSLPVSPDCARLIELTAVDTAATPQIAALAPPNLQAAMVPALRACLPESVLDRLDAGQSGWLTELRRVTVLFVLLPELDGPPHETVTAQAADAAQTYVRVVQDVIGRYEGSINKLHIDEKGAMLLAVFGLPPLSHPDDALRGVRAALLCQRILRSRSGPCAIGVASGHAFCGTVGNEIRREYTVLGDVVNLAARLMSANANANATATATVSGSSAIWCDAATYEATKASIVFAPAVSLHVKGRTERINAYAPSGEVRDIDATKPPELLGSHMVGRTEELKRFSQALRAQDSQPGGLILIEGAAGIGKSCLSGQLLTQARELGVNTLYGTGDAIERNTAYFVWTSVFRKVFNLVPGGAVDLAELRARLAELVPEQAGLFDLLDPVLHIQRDTAREDDEGWAASMASRGNAEQRHALLVQILARLQARGPLLLLIENAHWLDSASWALLWRVRREVPRLLLVVVSRPLAAIADAAVQAEYQKLRAEPGAELVQLEPLTALDTVALLCERLGVASLPQLLVDFIFEQTNGHPFFSTELAFALRDAGALRIANGTCRLTQTPDELRAQRFPTTMDGVVLSRIDRLRPQQLLLLKVASVVGRTFVQPIVTGVHPIPSDRPYVPRYLDDLEQHELTARHAAAELTYSFRHIIIQEVAYSTLPFAQRRQLHLAVAAWYEHSESAGGTASHRLADFYPLLAHHYSQAAEHPHASPGELRKAIEALRRAGDQALRSGATREALGLFDRALSLLARLPDDGTLLPISLSLRVPRSLGLGVVRGFAAPETEQALLACLTDLRRAGESSQLLPTLFGLWSFNMLRGRVWDARDYAAQIASEGSSNPESDAALAGVLVQQVTCLFLGELLASREHGETLQRRYQRDRHQHLTYLYGVDLEVMSLCHLGYAIWLTGDDAQALRTFQRALAIAQELGHPYSLGFALHACCIYHQSHDDLAATAPFIDALAGLASKYGYAHSALQSDFMRGWLLTRRGQAAAGIELMQRTLATRRLTGAELSFSHLLGILARCQLEAGQLDAALATIEDAHAQVARYGERSFAVSAIQVHAEILIRTSRGSFIEFPIDAGPDDLLLHAIDIARCQHASLYELRAVMVLCRLWAAQGNREEARTLLARTKIRLGDTFHARDEEAASALIKELGL